MSTYRAVPGARRLTIEEFERLPEDGYRSELVRGTVVREPPPGAEHGGVGVELARRLANFARERRLGRVIMECGFVLFEDPPTVRAPDVAFIAGERLPGGGLPSGYWRGAPDLAVEVVSPSNSAREIREKVSDYLEAGARLVWVVEPRRREVVVHRPGDEALTLVGRDGLDGADVLPGFRVEVAEIFDG